MCPSGTNINDAMLMAVHLLETATREEQLPSGSVSLLLLLTDGDPTVGEGTAQLQGTLPRGTWGCILACCGTGGRRGP